MFKQDIQNDRVLHYLVNQAMSMEATTGSRHVAAVVHKKRIVCIGMNSKKTHPMMKLYGKNRHAIYLHAEVDAIVKAINFVGSDFLSKCDLYVLRINKHDEVSSSKPCNGCQKAIQAFGIKNVYYT